MSDGSPALIFEFSPNGKASGTTVTARIGDEVLAVDKFDLSKCQSRGKFIDSICADRPGIDRKQASHVLMEQASHVLMEQASEFARRQAEMESEPPTPESAELLAKMPQPVRDEARAMLEADDGLGFMGRVLQDICALGVAGEQALATAIYLIGTSRLLAEPLGAIIQSPSSTGKTFVSDRVAKLFPPESILMATAMTPNSLYYVERDFLRHKFVVAGERSRRQDDDSADDTTALRELRSSGRLSKLFVDTSSKPPTTRLVELDGPISYIESTTASDIFNEDANRSLLLSTDERPEQTRRIIQQVALGRRAQGANIESVIQRHWAIQRMIERRPVAVPFSTQLANQFPSNRVEARRGFPQLLGMIEAVAILHQYQRKLDSDGRIVAEVRDYEFARHLCLAPLGRLLGGRISDGAIRFHTRLSEWATGTFTTVDAVIRDDGAERTVRGWLRELVSIGGIEQTRKHEGSRPAEWKLSDMSPADVASGGFELPEPASIRK
jgi:hypothetical protein